MKIPLFSDVEVTFRGSLVYESALVIAKVLQHQT